MTKGHVYNILPDDGDQNQGFRVYEQRHRCLVVQMFRDKPPTNETAEKNTAKNIWYHLLENNQSSIVPM